MKRVFGLLLLLLGLGACRHQHEPVIVSAADDGSTIVLRSGQRLQVELDSNPTTGYRWQLALPEDAPLRRVGEAEYRPDAHAEGIVGSGGREIWQLHAERAGNAALHFEYRRSFEPDQPPVRTADFQVNVR